MRWIITTLKYLILTAGLVSVVIACFVNFAPTFGAAPSGASLARVEASSNYADGQFNNIVDTQLDTSSPENPRAYAAYFSPPADKNPQSALPSRRLDIELLVPGSFVWLGHSSVLFNTDGKLILSDPVFNRASPVPLIGKAFELQQPTPIDDLPNIDVVIISHDHYDHLDHLAIQALNSRTKQFLVPLGLAAHLEHWGIPTDKIIELDWYESTRQQDIDFTLTPARHFSGRGINNRYSTLWGSWVVKSKDQSVFFSGDSGYFDEFKKIGQTYGPFDIAFMENGAYNPTWAQVHMTPEQSVQASIDLNANVLFPIHWGKFDLALHKWDEPIIRAKKAAELLDVTIATPLIGEVFTATEPPSDNWWEAVRGN